MKASKHPFVSKKTVSESAEVPSYKLLTQAGFLVKHGQGLFTYGPLALRVLDRLRGIIRRELDEVGALEVSMPFVQPASLWEETGRWDVMGPEMARMRDRKDASFCLAPTHEEVVTDVFRKLVQSYKQLPATFYQIGTKFRDEVRPRFGLLRAREFLMMDAYSFHDGEASLRATYEAMFAGYERIFRACQVDFEPVAASTGAMGGSRSHEFHVLADVGEDELLRCTACGHVANAELWRPSPEALDATACPRCAGKSHDTRRGIEVGHVFELGTKYTQSMQALVTGSDGKLFAPPMGCYGIGVSRLLAAIAEQHHDERGLAWPAPVAPFDAHLITVGSDPRIAEAGARLYAELGARGSAYWDDRDASFGQKIRDWELLGTPVVAVLGKGVLASGTVELRARAGGATITASLDRAAEAILALLRASGDGGLVESKDAAIGVERRANAEG